jgi:hypothetical protein
MSSNLLLAIALGLVLVASDAFGVERTIDGAYEINFTRAGRDYRVDQPNLGFVAGPYESREICRHAIQFVKVRQSGLRLRCDPVETARVR